MSTLPVSLTRSYDKIVEMMYWAAVGVHGGTPVRIYGERQRGKTMMGAVMEASTAVGVHRGTPIR